MAMKNFKKHGGFESEDGFVSTKEAYHGMGTIVTEAPTPYQALHIAGLDWEVAKCPLYGAVEVDGEETHMMEYPNKIGLYRTDKNILLGNASDHYIPIQNIQIADLIYDVAESEDLKVETAGSFKNGQRVFFQIDLGSMGLDIGDNTDIIKQYAMFHSGHDGKTGLSVRQTNYRVTCGNVESLALRDSAIKLRHMGDGAYDLTSIKAKLGDIKAQAKLFQRTMEKAIQTDWDNQMMLDYFMKTWQKGTKKSLPKKKDTKAFDKFNSTMELWHNYANFHEYQTDCHGTAYSAFQAVTQYATHDMHVRDNGNGKAEARQLNQMFGRGSRLGHYAGIHLQEALA